MQDVIAIILGGGRGERLYPLTKLRAKPALPLAGKYRLIDIPLSNCINSEINRIYVLTQFNSASLNRHIATTYHFSPFAKGFIEVLAAQQTPIIPDWFQGTADAVRKSLWVMEQQKSRDFLVLSGDHLYRMDYRSYLQHHRNLDSDVCIAVIPVDEKRAPNFGLMKTDPTGRVVDFTEKPRDEALESMKIDTCAFGLDKETATRHPYLASMGIYLFKRHILAELLSKYKDDADFGKHIIPAAIKNCKVQSFVFRGYWEDIGTMDTFFNANLALVRQPDPSFSFFDVEFPIFTRPRFLPPSKILDSRIENSMVCDGCIIRSAYIKTSIIGIRSRLEANTNIDNSLLMGADYYQSDGERMDDLEHGTPPIGIGEGAIIRNAIVDKNARIGRNAKIINKDNKTHIDRENQGYCIRSGIVIIIKNAIIPENTVI